jgi:hypothetical protein
LIADCQFPIAKLVVSEFLKSAIGNRQLAIKIGGLIWIQRDSTKWSS